MFDEDSSIVGGHPYISQENVYLSISFIFSFYMPEFFSVPVGDSKGTETNNFL